MGIDRLTRRELGLVAAGAVLASPGQALAQDSRSQGSGVIYAVAPNDDLNWYRHDGRGDGSFRWTDDAARKVGNGWNVKHVFSGGDGVI